MKPIICKYRVLLDCESTSYKLRANTPAVESVPFWANGPASHIFPENVIIKIPQVVQKIWRFSPSILALFIYFSDFLTFPYYKETNGVTCNRWYQQFFTFNLLLIGCLTRLTFMSVPDICHLSENIVKMHMQSRRNIVQLGNVSRGFGCHADW